jgi:predicted O-methyltransferase YrrM
VASLHELAVLFPNGPYFLGDTMGVMGDPLRHLYMAAAVATLADLGRPLRVLEIGSWTGFSTLTWAQALDELVPQKGSMVCVDPWASYWSPDEIQAGGVLATMDFMSRSDLSYNLFRHNLTFAPPDVRIDHIRGRSEEVLPYLADGAFNLIFVDGDHRYAAVAAELRMADRLLADGGLLCGDDLEFQASPAECTAVNPAVHYMKDPVTGIHYHPGVTRAVAEAFGPVSTYQGFFVMRKMHSSYRQVDLIGKTATIPRHFPADLKTALRTRCGKGAGD